MHKRDVWTYRGLDWGFILRDQTQLGLRCKNAWYFNAGILQKITPKIQFLCPPQATTLSLFPLPNTVRGEGTDSHSSWHFSKIITQRHQGDTTNYRQHIIPCTGSQHHRPNGLSSITIAQTKGTTNTVEKAKQLLNYLATNPDTTIRFHASDMIMNIHSNASYLPEANAQSRACGHFFMGWTSQDSGPIKLNGAFFTLCTILWFVVASAAKAKLGALFLNCKEGIIFWMTLKELDHPQPKTQVHCDNATAVGIANNTAKRQQSRSMEMRYFWVCDKIAQDAYDVRWHPGQENLADYQSKHHIGTHHQAVCPWYLHKKHSPLVLPRTTRPSTLKGCVGTLPKGYVCVCVCVNLTSSWDRLP